MQPSFPKHTENRQKIAAQQIENYQQGKVSFIPGLVPEAAINLPVRDVLQILRSRFGQSLEAALSEVFTTPKAGTAVLPKAIQSPVQTAPDGAWLKRVNMAGINVRTIGSFWHIIHYTLTLPKAQSAIHLLPIWEPGVVGSLYGMSSWQLNREFYSTGLAREYSHLNSVETQLKAVVNVLHLMGKTVGMDVIPHTDRFSEMALAYPAYFEWLRRKDIKISDHRENLHEAVQSAIFSFLEEKGAAVPGQKLPKGPADFFSEESGEAERLKVLFGPPEDDAERKQRRIALIKYLHQLGYEPVPATMAPPYRGLEVDSAETAKKIDENGLLWRDYKISKPEAMSRVFGPLARYKLYKRLNDNAEWEIDFSQPRKEVWAYVCRKYADVQKRFSFDFMRGDMSHVQMRKSGVPADPGPYYDLLKAVKTHIRQENNAAYFGYFAESFLAPPGVMGYGDEADHLEASAADTTLGDLQSMTVGSSEFLHHFRYYDDLRASRTFAPSFTLMTADKDDPRFDKFYLDGNMARMFIAFFLTTMPSYMGLGFETRDRHDVPAANEHYTKLYVFQESEGPKATSGPYQWGKNIALFKQIDRLRRYAEANWPKIQEQECRWLIPPNLSPESRVIAWTFQKTTPDYLFVLNLDTANAKKDITIPGMTLPSAEMQLDFATTTALEGNEVRLLPFISGYRIAELAPGEGRVYRRKAELLHLKKVGN